MYLAQQHLVFAGIKSATSRSQVRCFTNDFEMFFLAPPPPPPPLHTHRENSLLFIGKIFNRFRLQNRMADWTLIACGVSLGQDRQIWPPWTHIHVLIVPIPYLYTHFPQLDWLKKNFYTSKKSRAVIHQIYFPSDVSKDRHFGNINKMFMNSSSWNYESLFFWILSTCKLRWISHKLNIKLSSLWVIRRSLHIDKIRKINIYS